MSDRDVISSGVAWVGIWRTCFNSHSLMNPGFATLHCKYIRLTEAFAPPEIVAGQVLMILSLILGLCGNVGGVYSLRKICFGMEKALSIRSAFLITGALCLSAAAMSLIPLLWNLSSVVTNQTINFPPEFKMPPAPESQHVGSGIGVGMVGTALMIFSGVIFCTYRMPARSQTSPLRPVTDTEGRASTNSGGRDNVVFESHEHLNSASLDLKCEIINSDENNMKEDVKRTQKI